MSNIIIDNCGEGVGLRRENGKEKTQKAARLPNIQCIAYL